MGSTRVNPIVLEIISNNGATGFTSPIVQASNLWYILLNINYSENEIFHLSGVALDEPP